MNHVEPSFHVYQTSATTSSPHHPSAVRGIPGLVATSTISDISDRLRNTSLHSIRASGGSGLRDCSSNTTD